MSISDLLNDIGQNLASEGAQPKWLTMFLVSYPNPTFHSDDCKKFLTNCLRDAISIQNYPTEDYLHVMIKSKRRILIRSSGYFCFQNCNAEIREIKNITYWEQIQCVMESLEKRIEIKEQKSEPQTIWTIDPLKFEFTEEHEKNLHTRANEVLTFVEAFNEKPNAKNTRGPVVVRPAPLQCTSHIGRRPRLQNDSNLISKSSKG